MSSKPGRAPPLQQHECSPSAAAGAAAARLRASGDDQPEMRMSVEDAAAVIRLRIEVGVQRHA